MKVRSFLLVLIGLSLAASVSAYSLYERETLGNLTGSFDARKAAMGGFGVAEGFSLLDPVVNPATLGYLPGRLTIQATTGFIRDDDRRSIALYDSFDEVVDEGTYAENDNLYTDFAFSAASRTKLSGFGLGIGFAYRPLLNFACDYEEEVRTDDNQDNNTYPPVIAINKIEGSGRLNAYGINLGLDTETLPYVKKLALGLEVAPVSGAHNLKQEIFWTQNARDSVAAYGFSLPDSYTKTRTTFDGTRFTFGLRSQVNDRVGFGFTYAAKSEVDADMETTVLNNETEEYDMTKVTGGTLILPAVMHWGLSYQPRNVARTVFNVDMELTNWEDVNDFYENSMRYAFGVEHIVGNALPLRIGFRYETSPLDKSIALPTFTMGTGFDILDNLHLDLSGEFSNRNYTALDLFPDSYYDDTQYTEAVDYTSTIWSYAVPTDRGWDNPDKVEETFVKVMTTLSFHW